MAALWRKARAEEALTHFRAAVRQWPVEWSDDSFEDCLANAYLDVGRLDEAIAEYERSLRSGDRVQARRDYERFLQVWQAADEDIPEVIEAKQRLGTR